MDLVLENGETSDIIKGRAVVKWTPQSLGWYRCVTSRERFPGKARSG